LGVDLASPSGTPVKATSSGKIIFAGVKANYGKTVIIQHNQYSTLYAHLSGFSQGIHNGATVSRGQVIGRLGESGLATGPHVHYEFRVNNTHFDPLKVKLPTGEAIANNYRKQFLATATQLFAELDTKGKTLLAMHPGILR
jgi:murein DD-endopeptidase MepM/ murein hydrolase activator NlpD